MSTRKFKEIQRFRSLDVFILLGLFAVGLIYRAILGFLGWDHAAASESTYLLFAFLTIALFVYYFSIRLITVIDQKGIKYQFYPLHFRKHRIYWEEIDDLQVVDMPLQAALTGWSVRFSGEKRFSVTGRRSGLSIRLKNGEAIFLGTRHPEELRATIDRYRGNIS